LKDIRESVTRVVVEQLGVRPEKVTDEAHFENDLGADSLDAVELVMALEEEFGIEIPDEETERMKKVKDVIGYLEKRQKDII